MIHRWLFRFVLVLVATIEVTSALTRDFKEERKIWRNFGVHRFYGPWNVIVKRNGDYVDYNDYGVEPEHFRPNKWQEPLPYHDISIANRYIDVLPSARDSVLSKFNTFLSSVGIADFRTGIRTGNWTDRDTDNLKKQNSEDITFQNADEHARAGVRRFPDRSNEVL
ncbi:uncharacterized protein LOC109855945 [Pseudomyrmex gracilis]|uniref:uncharacterized protein LOC109855945 n=1 Tax=Pseudomyrmex gracilis TaxID=219809 RepID=UPI000995ABD6|nr:uncharacterized protein LOC109855945 [Pseudomyrmex gracilis]